MYVGIFPGIYYDPILKDQHVLIPIDLCVF